MAGAMICASLQVFGTNLQVQAEGTKAKDVSDVFPDIKDGAWYEEGVQYVYDKNIITGTDGLFNPGSKMTRKQLVTILYRLEGSPIIEDKTAIDLFPDVTEKAYYADAVCWAYNEKVTTGSNGLFKPENLLTREQMAAFLFRYAEVKGYDTEVRGDYTHMLNWQQLHSYGEEPMAWAVGVGLISGSEIKDANDNVIGYDLKPLADTTRAQTASIIMRFCESKFETIEVAVLETAYGTKMWKEVCAAFTAETGINVELTESKNLEDVIGPSLQEGEYPDVIHLSTGRAAALTEQFIQGNMITDITDVLSMTVPGEDSLVSEKIAGGFTETTLTNPYGDGKTYLAPMFYSPCGLFYNAGLLEEKGWEVPITWDEMWELGDKAAAEGISLFTYPTTGYLDAFFYSLMYSIGGADFFNAAATYEEGVWESPEAQKYFEIIGKLATYTNPMTPEYANDWDFTRNQQSVLDNEAIFMPNGTWIVGEMADAPRAKGFKWGMTALPAIEEGKSGYSYTWLEQAWIPSDAKNVDAAKQFVAFLYSDVACEIFAKAGAIQPVLGIADKLEGDNVMFYSIYDNGAKAATGNFARYDLVEGLGSFREMFLDPMNFLVSGDMTAEDWAESIISVYDLMRENLR